MAAENTAAAPSTATKPSSPPPAYSELPQAAEQPSSSQEAGTALQVPPHPHYGPTPIVENSTHLLPYYDQSSTHAQTEAVKRARLRFLGAILWALSILVVASVVLGVEIKITMTRPRRPPGPYESESWLWWGP